MPPGKRVYIKTFGCQMNENDSFRMRTILEKDGYIPVDDAHEADLILINTCSVREKSYHKAISAVGSLRKQQARRDVKIGVTGCVASQEGAQIAERFPFVDFVLGTDHIDKIKEALQYTQHHDGVYIAADFDDIEDYDFPKLDISTGERMVKAYVTIMKGCDNTCSFCIVPFTRGREVSRPEEDIITEVQELTKRGVREVTLLGQNVNSYGRFRKTGAAFPELLRMIEKRTQIPRIRFTSPHPKDLSGQLIDEYAQNTRLCRHIHLPVQSGSSQVLKKMRRAHTRETYLKRITALRQKCPDVSITTDIIVGFPGETDADFQDTLDLVREVAYDASYSFCYSERPGTEAAQWEDDVPDTVKSQRLQELQALQSEISLNKNRELLGQRVAILVEGRSKSGVAKLMGRTSTNKVVNFEGKDTDIGDILDVRITSATAYALTGEKTR